MLEQNNMVVSLNSPEPGQEQLWQSVIELAKILSQQNEVDEIIRIIGEKTGALLHAELVLLLLLVLLLPEPDERVGRSIVRCCGSLRVGRVSLLGRCVSRCGRGSSRGCSYERRLGVGSSRRCGRVSG